MAAEQQTKVAGGNRFAAACRLLRQYMKEQGGGGGAATMGLMPPGAQGVEAVVPVPVERIKKTMELFPLRAGTLKNSSHQSRILEPERAPLTIFYGGSTVAFDDFPADKADELMQLANSFVAGAEHVCPNILLQPFLADMPVARSASLQRFLEKRKSRLPAADPYPVRPLARAAKDMRKRKPVDGAPWLGINSVIDLN